MYSWGYNQDERSDKHTSFPSHFDTLGFSYFVSLSLPSPVAMEGWYTIGVALFAALGTNLFGFDTGS